MRLKRGWPSLLFVVLLVAIPTFEVWLLVQVAHQIGFWLTLLILVVEAALGAWLMRREGNRAWQALMATFSTGRVPGGELADAALVLVGGVLLILPGFATDLIGFLFLLPLSRPLARRLVAFFVARRINRLGGVLAGDYGRNGPAGGTVIRGETVETPDPAGDQIVISGEITDGPGSPSSGERQSGPPPVR